MMQAGCYKKLSAAGAAATRSVAIKGRVDWICADNITIRIQKHHLSVMLQL